MVKKNKKELIMMLKQSSNIGMYDSRFEKESCGVGFVAHIKKEPSHENIKDALTILCNMDHRGARGAEPNSGDGAGILTGMPHDFFSGVAKEAFSVDLDPERYSVGNIFLPNDKKERDFCKDYFSKICDENGLKVVGWRNLPIDKKKADIGPSALDAMPYIEQIFIIDSKSNPEHKDFERRLYLSRKK
jgi:Glutamate synthase domain 1